MRSFVRDSIVAEVGDKVGDLPVLVRGRLNETESVIAIFVGGTIDLLAEREFFAGDSLLERAKPCAAFLLEDLVAVA